MIIGIVIEIATLFNAGGVPPVLCFATTDWNLNDAEDWDDINSNWNNCL
jgi:hypothetical protein